MTKIDSKYSLSLVPFMLDIDHAYDKLGTESDAFPHPEEEYP